MHIVSQRRGLGEMLRCDLCWVIWGWVQGSRAFPWIGHHRELEVVLCLGVLIHLIKKAGRMNEVKVVIEKL